MEKENLALEMLRELKAQSKRWFCSFIIVLFLWFATIGVFIWYINQPIEEIETTTTQDADTEGSNSPINQNNDEIFGYEDVCELAALSNNSINKIVNLYLKEKEL